MTRIIWHKEVVTNVSLSETLIYPRHTKKRHIRSWKRRHWSIANDGISDCSETGSRSGHGTSSHVLMFQVLLLTILRKQIYQIYDDTVPGNELLTAAMKTFSQNAYLPQRRGLRDNENDLSSYRAIAPHLFGFMPLTIAELPANHALRSPCALCSKPFTANQEFDSSVVKLHCAQEHHFHLSCIFTFWDMPGKYLHRCPTCREAAQLNWKRVGLEGHIATFAHNLSGWHVSKETIAHIDDDSEEGRRARDLYDVPAMPGKFNKDTLEDLHDAARMWYAHQNMAVLCALSNTLTWEPMRFEKFSLARVPRPPLRTGAINPWPMDAVYREIGRRWMNLEFNTGNRSEIRIRMFLGLIA
jgi:hypothetical protein